MKKFFVVFFMMFTCTAHATTVNIDWLMDGSTYAQTTCETGGIFSLPTPTPTKYGYHFVGWQQNDAVGSWSQSGTPTPTNPIYPTFKQFGNTVLRAVGSGDNMIADSYNPTTRKITRRVGFKVFDGTETFNESTSSDYRWNSSSYATKKAYVTNVTCSHLQYSGETIDTPFIRGLASENISFKNMPSANAGITNVTTFKQWLADQYANGTPVTIYYPLATPVEENYNIQ